ncbi:hypothetical protein DL764_004730 [Monosporascus ibericus]|uniref:Uncharacterized protein n=1 Tax=Monosporascus ibericus TaxID=155417 RepID=A0A4Q4TBL7_9PEZI|nr:hypothetical protein DL764_004730 [Monosporascus ibericus]
MTLNRACWVRDATHHDGNDYTATCQSVHLCFVVNTQPASNQAATEKQDSLPSATPPNATAGHLLDPKYELPETSLSLSYSLLLLLLELGTHHGLLLRARSPMSSSCRLVCMSKRHTMSSEDVPRWRRACASASTAAPAPSEPPLCYSPAPLPLAGGGSSITPWMAVRVMSPSPRFSSETASAAPARATVDDSEAPCTYVRVISPSRRPRTVGGVEGGGTERGGGSALWSRLCPPRWVVRWWGAVRDKPRLLLGSAEAGGGGDEGGWTEI